VFVPLYKLFVTYGPVFRLSFGPKSFVVVSDNQLAKQARCVTALCSITADPDDYPAQ